MSSPKDQIIPQLISAEEQVHYDEPPPREVQPFIFVARNSPILISAPHGSRTFRNNGNEVWHEEDEYTAAMALLLSERCNTSVMANIWRSDLCDPNEHEEKQCAYKQKLREIVHQQNIRWVLDLHGAAETSLGSTAKLVDLGTRKHRQSLAVAQRDQLRALIEERLGAGCVSLDYFAAQAPGRITAFCQEQLNVQAVQIEMKPFVRVPARRVEASSYATLGPFAAPPDKVIAMLSALEHFITYLKQLPQT
jgi:hypothetical protein